MINNSNFDLYIDEGTDFAIYLLLENVDIGSNGVETIVPVDLTGVSSVTAQVRARFNDTTPLMTFSAAITSALGGEIALSLTATQTQNIETIQSIPTVHIGYYDVIINKTSGAKTKLVGGKVWLNQTVTR